MALTALSSITSGFGINTDVIEIQRKMDDLTRQLATGKRSTTYGGLGTDRLLVLSLQTRIPTVDAFRETIDLVQIRLTAVQQHLERTREIAAETRTDFLVPDYTSLNAGKTIAQTSAAARLDELLALLNLDVGGRHLFSGRTTDIDPVVSSDVLLNGQGTAAGFEQVAGERLQADLGAAGLGRLTVTNVTPTVTLAEDAAGHPFGFKLAAAVSSLTGTVVTGPAGAPATLDVAFSATLPLEGETVSVTFDLPDGTQEQLVLTATTASPAGTDEFTIGIDENDTAVNFEAALNASVQRLAQTTLSAASTMAASRDFFFYDSTTPPQRVDGPPFDSAVALRDATTTDTVFWYQGDNGSGAARDSAIAHVDDNIDIAYGTRANEEALATLVGSLAALVSQSFDDTVPNDKLRYDALTARAGGELNFKGIQSVEDMIVDLGFKQRSLDDTAQRHTASQQISLDLLQQKEGVDNYEVSAKILRLQTQLQASFETTAIMSRLSLVNFL